MNRTRDLDFDFSKYNLWAGSAKDCVRDDVKTILDKADGLFPINERLPAMIFKVSILVTI